MADKKSKDQTEDQELNDLLDNALKDFDEGHVEAGKDIGDTKEEKSTTGKQTEKSLEDAWANDFIMQTASDFEENLQNLIQNGTENELGASLQKMALSLAGVIKDKDGTEEEIENSDFQSAIAQALNDLSTTSENLQSNMDLSGLLGQTSLEDAQETFLPFIQNVLQHLLSKEILYPSVKELVDKYPEWLEENKESLSSDDLQRFTKQLELMRKLCIELENETQEDSEEAKKKRFETIMTLLRDVQSCGLLPKELIGDQCTPFQVDGDGDPAIPALLRSLDSQQTCRLM